MAKKKVRFEDVNEDLNLLPIMNLICLLIPFLLLAAQFIKIGVIMIQTPTLNRPNRQDQKKEQKPLNLTLVMTDKGYYIKSRHGAECPEGISEDSRLCFPKQEGKYTPAVVKKLQHHLWFLFQKKYKDCSNYASTEPKACKRERHSLQIVPEPTVKYSDLIRTLDAIRERPTDAKNPPSGRVDPKGCTLKYSKAGGAYGFPEGSNLESTACMYYRVTLALGSS